MYISVRMEDLFNRPASPLRHIASNPLCLGLSPSVTQAVKVVNRPASPLRYTAGNPLRLGLSPSVTQAVKVVNAIFHLIIKDWGGKTTQSIGKQV